MNGFRSTRSQALALVTGLMLAGLPMLAFAQTDTTGSDAAGLFGGAFVCFCYLIGFVIEVALTWWVYNDAKKRGNPNAILWAVVTFFLGLIGLLIYILVGRNQGTAMGGPPPTGPAGPSTTVRY
jgi:apolipoprotein N-acyltransferase